MAPKCLLHVCLIAVVLLQPLPHSLGDFLPSFLSPIPEQLCKTVECGKGSCKPPSSNPLSYECECDAGWKKFEDISFFPCVIPNCSLDTSCMEGVSSPKENTNRTILDPCYWADCGGGTCNKTSIFTYECVCQEGYYNLLNTSIFPCFKQCAIGLDCSGLGISSPNTSVASPDVAENNHTNASPAFQGCSPWPIIAMLLVTLSST
ncbi:hypothetical protein SAY87_018972 [Trapa incisa]|uniref:Uncharacterized protein n=1 Tax=Trapa incisa TaxID=236973 RepID=A0AAN7K2Y2_9MYRT|nr:hypothetical protein SAY87_018972 [Trapa incisa]